MKEFLICLLALAFTAIGSAQNYRVESFTVAEGLSQGLVTSLLQDNRGFIWFGTLDGLNRYDGYQIKRFTSNYRNPWALKAHSIYCIAEDARGLLWLGTEKGLVVMDPYTERFFQLTETYRAPLSSTIIDLNIKADGQIWFFYNTPTEKRVFCIHPPDGLIRLIREDRLRCSDFGIHDIPLPAGLNSPLIWLSTGHDTVIAMADWEGRQFYRISPKTLQMQRTDPHTLDYQKWGNYGLLAARNATRGFAFPLRAGGKSRPADGSSLIRFLQLPGGLPLIYLSDDYTLYELDTTLFQPKTPGLAGPDFYRPFKPFLRLDQPLAYTAMVDRADNLWVSTTGYGIRKISRRKLDCRQYLAFRSLLNFTVLPDGRVWPGHNGSKVINLQTDQLEAAPWPAVLPESALMINLLISRSGDWWMVAKQDERLLLMKKACLDSRWQVLPVELKYKGSQLPLLEDQWGNIWLAGPEGQILRIRPDNHVDSWLITPFFPTPLAGDLRSTCLVEDAHGQLWIGQNGGLVRVTNPDGEPVFQVWHNYTERGPLFNSDFILSLYPDPAHPGRVWLGTRGGGLVRFDSRTGAAETYTEADGLANNVVYGMLPDAFGYLWLSTNRGLSRFNPRNRTFNNLPDEEPKLSTEFNTGSYALLPTGELAFGSIEGLFVIRPLAEEQSGHPGVVAVTQLKINGITLDPADDVSGWTFTAQQEISLRLPFDRNNLSIEFAALQTDDATSSQYRYRVLGIGTHWIPTGHQHTVNLVAIPPGDYTIELQSIGVHGDWADAPVTRVYIEIQPPWYRSGPAWWLYASLAALLLYLYIYYERRRVRLKYEVNLSRKEMDRLKSLDDFKNRFFGYISHEFKTPLTIIMGEAKRLPDEQRQPAAAIFQQGQSMLEMVDQMVDITRLDEQALQLNWRNGNFSDYVHYLVESLRSLAELKNIRLHFQTAVPELTMDFDPLRLKYILNNLLANAVQHTPSGGQIGISIYGAGPEQVRLAVSDNGAGIAPEDLPNIFERYYQGSADHPQPHHFGLGLAFVRDLLQLFSGKIEASSQPGSGTVFTITLPVIRNAPPLETSFPGPVYSPPAFTGQPDSDVKPSKKSLPLLLIVEDNPFIANFLQATLAIHFRLEFAPDGLAGSKKALALIPDLILTDVMMPGMDGYEMTHLLKNQELTGHIPVVMLSARSGLSDRLTGQQLGADAYLGKPFDEQELVLILQNLHRSQHRWRERYAGLTKQSGLTEGPTQGLEQPEATVRQTDAFMLKLYALFENNYPDEEYDLLQLSHDLEMSKSQLRRKLAALSDQSPMQLLRQYRLQKAHQLLSENPHANVKEVCFQVGFKDPSHFSRLFSRTFQVAPSEVQKVQG